MSKKYGIGFFIAMIVIVALFSFAYRMSYHHVQDQYEQEAETRTQGNIEVCYYIKEKDGYVIVYEADQKTVYEYTTIRVEELPEDMQKSIRSGIKVDSPGQIYGFLENYSS